MKFLESSRFVENSHTSIELLSHCSLYTYYHLHIFASFLELRHIYPAARTPSRTIIPITMFRTRAMLSKAKTALGAILPRDIKGLTFAGFSKLPPEIRQLIWDRALPAPRQIKLWFYCSTASKNRDLVKNDPLPTLRSIYFACAESDNTARAN